MSSVSQNVPRTLKLKELITQTQMRRVERKLHGAAKSMYGQMTSLKRKQNNINIKSLKQSSHTINVKMFKHPLNLNVVLRSSAIHYVLTN